MRKDNSSSIGDARDGEEKPSSFRVVEERERESREGGWTRNESYLIKDKVDGLELLSHLVR